MSQTSVACPKCGAAIFYPTFWHGIGPPPAQYTCNCHVQPSSEWRTEEFVAYNKVLKNGKNDCDHEDECCGDEDEYCECSVTYDEDYDVLYVRLKNTPSYAEHLAPGIYVDLAMGTREVIGFTVLNYKKKLSQRH